MANIGTKTSNPYSDPYAPGAGRGGRSGNTFAGLTPQYNDMENPEYMSGAPAWSLDDKKFQQKQLEFETPGMIRDVWGQTDEAQRRYGQDPRLQRGLAAWEDQALGFGSPGSQTGNIMDDMYNQGFRGQDSVVDKTAQAQRQQMQQGIANQAAMASRGGYNPAMMRASMMAQGKMGGQMAAQVAAAKSQERLNAQRAFLMARQQRVENTRQYTQGREQALGSIWDVGGRRYEQQTSARAGYNSGSV